MSLITHDEIGFPITFECENVNSTETPTPVTMNFNYDLAWDTTNMTQDLSRAYVEGNLLQQLAAYYGFWGGHACNNQLENRAWFVELSSLNQDVPNPTNATCRELVPGTDEGCTSYSATMTGNVIGASDVWETIGLIALQINSGAVVGTLQTSIRIKFLDADDGLDYTYDETGRDVLTPPAVSNGIVQATAPAVSNDNESLTIVGIAMVAGLTMAVVGVILVIARKKRSRKRPAASSTTKASSAHARSAPPLPPPSSDLKSDGGDTKSVTRLDVDDDDDDLTLERDFFDGPYDEQDNLPQSPDASLNREYNFDLGGWMKSELVGIHGESAVTAAQASRHAAADEVLYDSDNDSWAQTEATIGSLELRLDPIEAEV